MSTALLPSGPHSNGLGEGPIHDAYQAELTRRGYQADADQLAAVAVLEELADHFAVYKSSRSNAFKRLIHHPDVPSGVWFWGGVGRGKSFIMDCFFEAVPVTRKIRVHFHEFMREIHRELTELKHQEDPLDVVAAHVASRARLICFDEFHISDIADAMILERLLRALFKHGLCLVATSNYEPDRLYPDGLHRDRILPAIALLKQHVAVVRIDAGEDYRRRSLDQVDVYMHPVDASSNERMKRSFEALAERTDEDPEMSIENRKIRALRRAGGVIWFDFETLCVGPRSQNDYLEIASRFHTVLVSGIPAMSAAMASEARRFTWLIDIFYDQKVKVFLSAQVEPEALYTHGQLANEFQRTVSRILEMQSKEYLHAPKRSGHHA